MKQIVVIIMLFMMAGCASSGPAVKNASSEPEYKVPAGTFESQVGGSKVELLTAKREYFIEPPLNISETPLKRVLDMVFIKAGAKYVIEGSLIEHGTPITLKIEKREKLEDILRVLFIERAIKFEIDGNNVYHIKMNLTPLDR